MDVGIDKIALKIPDVLPAELT